MRRQGGRWPKVCFQAPTSSCRQTQQHMCPTLPVAEFTAACVGTAVASWVHRGGAGMMQWPLFPETPSLPHPNPAHLDQGDGAADLRLWRDVADDEAVRAAGEAAVGDERAVVAQASAHDGGGGGEHLRHAGAALGALVPERGQTGRCRA